MLKRKRAKRERDVLSRRVDAVLLLQHSVVPVRGRLWQKRNTEIWESIFSSKNAYECWFSLGTTKSVTRINWNWSNQNGLIYCLSFSCHSWNLWSWPCSHHLGGDKTLPTVLSATTLHPLHSLLYQHLFEFHLKSPSMSRTKRGSQREHPAWAFTSESLVGVSVCRWGTVQYSTVRCVLELVFFAQWSVVCCQLVCMLVEL